MSNLADSPLAMLSMLAVFVERAGGATTITQAEMSEVATNANLHHRVNEDGDVELATTRRIIVPAANDNDNVVPIA